MKKKLAIGALALAILFTSGSALAAKPTSMSEFKGRVENVSTRMDNILNRFESVMNKAEDKGYNTSKAQEAYDAAVVKRDAAKSEVSTLISMIDAEIADGAGAPSAELRAQIKDTKDALLAYRDSVKELRDDLKEVIDAHTGEDAPAEVPEPAV